VLYILYELNVDLNVNLKVEERPFVSDKVILNLKLVILCFIGYIYKVVWQTYISLVLSVICGLYSLLCRLNVSCERTYCVLIMCFEVVIEIWYRTFIINYFAIMHVLTRLRPKSHSGARNSKERDV